MATAWETVLDPSPGTHRHTQYIVYSLAESIRERDIITYEHSRRVAVYVNRLARHLGWPRHAGRDLALAALVHDLGKTWMQNELLHKESALSADERAMMERHPGIAARILVAYGAPDSLIEVVLHHHESFDGTGYPDHLSGAAIPLGARLLTVADVFDALTSDRPYKSAMDAATALERMTTSMVNHFDPVALSAFLDMLGSYHNFVLSPRVSALPVRPAPHPTWVHHDNYE